MDKKVCLILFMFVLIAYRSVALDTYPGSSALDRKDKVNKAEKNVGTEKEETDDDENQKDDEFSPSSGSRRNRYQGYGSAAKNGRSRFRAPSFFDDASNKNDRSRGNGLGFGGMFNLQGLAPPPKSDNGLTCHSILDSQYTIFSDLCGVMPQARYSLPNFFGHTDKWQIVQTLTILLGSSLSNLPDPSCSRSLRLLVCPLLFPPCKPRREALSSLPCQTFCRAVQNQCPVPSIEHVPCDYLAPKSEVCPSAPSPFSSFLGSSFPLGGIRSGAGVSSLFGQSGFSSPLTSGGFPPAMPPASLSAQSLANGGYPSMMPTSGRSPAAGQSPMNFFNAGQFSAESLTPVLVDFPPMGSMGDMRQANRMYPFLRSASEKA